jgi:uncharacterized membrane protein YdjX (TVP38/TMEM64 family)
MLKKIILPFFISAITIIVTFLLFEDLELFFVSSLNATSGHPLFYTLVSFLVLASDIVLPVPSSIVMYTNGYVLGLFSGSMLSLIALMIGSTVGYYLGRFTSMGIKSTEDERAQTILSNYGTLSILVTRGIPIIAESICIVCGYNKMPFRQYFIMNLIGYVPLCLLYAFCGSIGYSRDTFLISFACSLCISAIFWLVGKKFLKGNLNTVAQKND